MLYKEIKYVEEKGKGKRIVKHCWHLKLKALVYRMY